LIYRVLGFFIAFSILPTSLLGQGTPAILSSPSAVQGVINVFISNPVVSFSDTTNLAGFQALRGQFQVGFKNKGDAMAIQNYKPIGNKKKGFGMQQPKPFKCGVGVRGFEPPTTRPPDVYSNRAELHPAIPLTGLQM